MYECCLSTIQAYARCNLGRHSLEVAAEEDSFSDIQLLMELLTNLLSKDFIDLSPPGKENHNISINILTYIQLLILYFC